MSGDPVGGDSLDMSTATNVRRLIALMIGIASITVGVLTWRASQINSTAAFDDRTSVGQTITQARRDMDVTIEASAQAADYAAYVQADDLAGLLDAQAAADVRSAATERARRVGVLTAFELDGVDPGGRPPGFDIDARVDSLRAQAETGFDSGGPLTPDRFAERADDIRDRVRALQVWALVILFAIGALTLAEVTDGRVTRRSAGALGSLVFIVAAVAAFTQDFAV